MGRLPIRFWVIFMIFLTMYVSFSARVIMSISIVAMTHGDGKPDPDCGSIKNQSRALRCDTHEAEAKYGPQHCWSEIVQGLILGSYFLGYSITTIPGVYITNWIGPFHAIFWTHIIIAVLNSGCSYGPRVHFVFLVLPRFFMGICAGITYPALQRLIILWAPPVERPKFITALLGNVVGTCVTWPLVGLITEKFGYEWGFHFVSIEIVVFCIAFLIVTTARDGPSNNKWISSEEAEFISNAQALAPPAKKVKPPYKDMMRSSAFWILAICHFGNVWGLNLQLLGVPKLLSEVLGFNLVRTGIFSALPQFTRVSFGLFFGVIGQFLRVRNDRSCIRKSFTVASHILPGISLICISFIGCKYVIIVVLLTICLSLNGAVAITALSNTNDLSPNFDQAIFGLINCFGVTTGFITPLITGVLISKHNGIAEWGWNFIIAGCVYIFCGLIFIIFGTSKEQKWNAYTGDKT